MHSSHKISSRGNKMPSKENISNHEISYLLSFKLILSIFVHRKIKLHFFQGAKFTSMLPVRQPRATPMLKVLDGIEKALFDDIVSFALCREKRNILWITIFTGFFNGSYRLYSKYITWSRFLFGLPYSLSCSVA